MLELAIGLLITALIAGALGFRGVARGAGNIAKLIFVAIIVVADLIFVLGLLGICRRVLRSERLFRPANEHSGSSRNEMGSCLSDEVALTVSEISISANSLLGGCRRDLGGADERPSTRRISFENRRR
jgi:uncharacterized membrane protein YtjA (UPF0391 family)